MESIGSNFKVETEQIWKTTLQDGPNRFINFAPGVRELTTEELKGEKKEKDEFELSEANCISSLSPSTSQEINKNKLYYFPAKMNLFKVIDVVKSTEGVISCVKLVGTHSSETLELSSSAEISSLRDYVRIHLKFSLEGSDDTIVCANVKVQSPFEKEIESSLRSSINKPSSMFKFVYEGAIFDKSNSLSQLSKVSDDMYFLGIIGFTNKFMLNRFKPEYFSPYWSSNVYTPDALMFIPSQTIFLCGFSLFSPRDAASYEVKYTIFVDNTIVEERGPFVCSEWVEIYYHRITLDDIHEVKPNSQLEILIVCGESISGNTGVATYYGYYGDQYKDLNFDNKEIWTIKDSPKSKDTSLYCGNIPEIMYYM